jgi:NADPH:quinone reductase-like Zn-dependent oxidoreductase
MKAIQYNEYGGDEVLNLVEIDPPHAGQGQIRISVKAAGVNPLDWKLRAGVMHDFLPVDFPSGVGFEAAGVVDEVGDGVSDVAVGDRVFGFGRNVVAENAVLTTWSRMPDAMPFEIGAAMSTAVETSIRALNAVGAQAGETVLIDGAAGGVGSAAVQIARARGLTVIGTASAPKHDYLRDLGASPVAYGDGLAERVRTAAPHGVDLALDLVGAGNVPTLIEIVGEPSRVISIVDFTAPEYGAQFSPKADSNPASLVEGARLFETGALKLHIQQSFPIDQTAEALALSSQGHVTGKLVITVP